MPSGLACLLAGTKLLGSSHRCRQGPATAARRNGGRPLLRLLRLVSADFRPARTRHASLSWSFMQQRPQIYSKAGRGKGEMRAHKCEFAEPDHHIDKKTVFICCPDRVCACTSPSAIQLAGRLAWPEIVHWTCPSGWWLGWFAHFLSTCPRARRSTSARATDCAENRAFGNRVAAWSKLAPDQCFGYI